MNTPSALERKKFDRYRVLEALYKETDGVAMQHSVDLNAVASDLQLDPDRLFAAFDYLQGEGLTDYMSLGPYGGITHLGVKEVEQAMARRPSKHFPANITIISGAGNNVQISAGDNVQQNQKIDSTAASEELKVLLESIQHPLPQEAEELVELAKEASKHQFQIASAASALVERSQAWIAPLKKFIAETRTEIGAKLIAEAFIMVLKARGQL